MFEWFYITTQGKALLARAQVGVEMRFTKAQMGNGALQTGQNMEQMTELIAPVKDLPLAGIKTVNDMTTVTVQVSNADMGKGIWFREMGLFAEDPQGGEILYAYANAGARADYLPAPTESRVDYVFALNCTIGNAQNITFELKPSQVFLTVEDVIGVERGGTGATTAEAARENLNAAGREHTHAATEIAAGTIDADRLPVVPVGKGGTGRTDGKAAALASARTIGLSGGATGTGTAFDGSGDILIPVTALDVGKAAAGTLAIGRGGTGAATAVNARKALKIQCGYVSHTITTLGAAGYASFDVQFPEPFSSVPIVVLSGNSNTSGRMNGLILNVGTRSATGFSIDVYNPTSGSSGTFEKGMHWVAIEN